MDYIHDRENWPKLTWSPERLGGQLAGVRHRQGRLIGRMEGLGFSLRNEAVALRSVPNRAQRYDENRGWRLA